MSFEEALEVTALYSISGNVPAHGLIAHRPFRDPHHSISDVGLVGGGTPSPRPGEISLAHNGVLFLDELPEFKRAVLEVLRQPLENGVVNITRRLQTVTYPAQFMLIASMNACPCGNLGSLHKTCTCSPEIIQRYQSRISGPLLDRIDLQIEVGEIPYDDLHSSVQEESSIEIKKRVQKCREIQIKRYKNSTTRCNAQMNISELKTYCEISSECHALMRRVIDKLGLSARSHNRILKIARTIADMNASPNIELPHLSEAISYRILDRKMLQPVPRSA